MAVCKPAAASGCVQSAVQRWWNVAGVKYSRQWPSIAPVAAMHLLTLTAPHTRFDVLEELQAKLGKALNGFLADKTVKKIFKEMGYIGQIRGYEVTHGRKG